MEVISRIRRLIATPGRVLLAQAARSYIAGPELSDAVNSARSLARRGIASTICFWDGVHDPPQNVAGMYRRTLDALSGSGLDSYLSIKAPSVGFDAACLSGILEQASNAGIVVHFDSLGVDAADSTFRLIEQCWPRHPRLGCTLPGRWRRSLADAESVIALNLRVRVVKGQWPDPQVPDRDTHRGFLELVEALAGRACHVAVATHNPGLAARAVDILQQTRTSCELELLLGLPDREVLKSTARFQVPIRYYIPFGHAWLPYALSQARNNPRTIWWIVRDSFFARRPHSFCSGMPANRSARL